MTSKLTEAVRYALKSARVEGSQFGYLQLTLNSGLYASVDQIVADFVRVRSLRPSIANPFVRIALSTLEENLSRREWHEVSTWTLAKIGLNSSKHQTIASQHFDTRNAHLHAVVNRIGTDGNVWGAEWSAMRLIEACQHAERHFSLKLSPGRTPGASNVEHGSTPRRAPHDSIAASLRGAVRDKESPIELDTIRDSLLKCAAIARSLDDFKRCALSHGILVRDSSTARSRPHAGLVVRVTGSTRWVGLSNLTNRELSGPKLQAALENRLNERAEELQHEDEEYDQAFSCQESSDEMVANDFVDRECEAGEPQDQVHTQVDQEG